jgi:Tripartite tricarboxylate transporter family receptor
MGKHHQLLATAVAAIVPCVRWTPAQVWPTRPGRSAGAARAPHSRVRRRSILARIRTILMSRAGWLKQMTRHAFRGTIMTLALASTDAQAEDNYPSRPVHMVIPFAAGGPTDIVGRIMGAKMGELLGQQFVVEDKSGAGGNIGADLVAKSPPDGYTVLMATVSTHAINPGLYKHMPYDPIRDFAPIGRVGVTPTLLGVNPSIPATDVKSLVALIKANPGKFSYGSSGVGSILNRKARLILRGKFRPAISSSTRPPMPCSCAMICIPHTSVCWHRHYLKHTTSRDFFNGPASSPLKPILNFRCPKVLSISTRTVPRSCSDICPSGSCPTFRDCSPCCWQAEQSLIRYSVLRPSCINGFCRIVCASYIAASES